MSQYVLERTKKIGSIWWIMYSRYFHKHVDHIQLKLLKNCVRLSDRVYLIKTRKRVFQLLKIDEHSYPYLVFSRQ